MNERPQLVSRVVSCWKCSGVDPNKTCDYCHGTTKRTIKTPVKPASWTVEQWADYLDVTR